MASWWPDTFMQHGCCGLNLIYVNIMLELPKDFGLEVIVFLFLLVVVIGRINALILL